MLFCFRDGPTDFTLAVSLYTQAIDLAPENPIYLSNRAFAHLKLENFGSALEDAGKAIEIEPTYTKAYYRRGSAHLALLHFKEGLADFKKVCKVHNVGSRK